MKLPVQNLSLRKQLSEFDLWLTPSLREIQDTEKYKKELNKVAHIFSVLGSATNSFDSIDHCRPEKIAETCVDLIENKISTIENINDKIRQSVDILESFSSLLFTVTGKSDNNLKCQFPVYLLHNINRTTFPQKRSRRGEVYFEEKELGRVLKSDKISKLISEVIVWSNENSDLSDLKNEAILLLGNYVSSILQNTDNIKQFWSLGRSYFYLKGIEPGSERALLAPIITFKVRGSVSASGGHIPEDILRSVMDLWGLERGVDYNTEDVTIENDINKNTNQKTRAYDFILPYQTEGWEQSIFIQCQFYAGDSGSVSHKVVDQTAASRPKTIQQFPNARFVEYIDGAGYFASLNPDLAHMMRMKTTKAFIQVRSLNIRLRREVQQIGFVTPIEIEHAILRSEDKKVTSIRTILQNDGYNDTEISRGLTYSLNKRFIQNSNDTLIISPDRIPPARRLLILDIIAITGGEFESMAEPSGGSILIPGYGPYYGTKIRVLSKKIDYYTKNINYDRMSFCDDIDWLCEQKYVILK